MCMIEYYATIKIINKVGLHVFGQKDIHKGPYKLSSEEKGRQCNTDASDDVTYADYKGAWLMKHTDTDEAIIITLIILLAADEKNRDLIMALLYVLS